MLLFILLLMWDSRRNLNEVLCKASEPLTGELAVINTDKPSSNGRWRKV